MQSSICVFSRWYFKLTQRIFYQCIFSKIVAKNSISPYNVTNQRKHMKQFYIFLCFMTPNFSEREKIKKAEINSKKHFHVFEQCFFCYIKFLSKQLRNQNSAFQPIREKREKVYSGKHERANMQRSSREWRDFLNRAIEDVILRKNNFLKKWAPK